MLKSPFAYDAAATADLMTAPLPERARLAASVATNRRDWWHPLLQDQNYPHDPNANVGVVVFRNTTNPSTSTLRQRRGVHSPTTSMINMVVSGTVEFSLSSVTYGYVRAIILVFAKNDHGYFDGEHITAYTLPMEQRFDKRMVSELQASFGRASVDMTIPDGIERARQEHMLASDQAKTIATLEQEVSRLENELAQSTARLESELAQTTTRLESELEQARNAASDARAHTLSVQHALKSVITTLSAVL